MLILEEARSESINHISDINRAYEWIIDNGESHHMTCVLKTLADIHLISLCMVGLMNEKTVLAY